MGRIAEVKDVVDAVLYLAQAGQVTGEVLHVDGGHPCRMLVATLRRHSFELVENQRNATTILRECNVSSGDRFFGDKVPMAFFLIVCQSGAIAFVMSIGFSRFSFLRRPLFCPSIFPLSFRSSFANYLVKFSQNIAA